MRYDYRADEAQISDRQRRRQEKKLAELQRKKRLEAAAPALLAACEAAKKYLEPDLVEPGRSVFWKLVQAIAKAEKTVEPKITYTAGDGGKGSEDGGSIGKITFKAEPRTEK